jgi:DNA-directed RNA polymerase specialized sigma24 family protein
MQIEIDSASDQAILSALREAKVRQAAGLLVRYYGNSVYNVCRSLVTDNELSEDLTQETFRRAFSELGSIQGSSSPRSWLIGIAQRACAAALEAVADPELPELEPMTTADTGSWRISESLQRRLEALASAL